VPHEMKGLMTDHVLPMLKQRYQMPHIVHKTLLTAGVGESFLAEMINGFETALPSTVKLAYLPSYGMVRLRLTGTGEKQMIEPQVDTEFARLKELVKEYLVVDEDIPMEVLIGRLLKEKNKTLSVAESCTGGYIAHLLTSVAGSSAYFTGGIVSYDNSVKENLLKVQRETLQTVGAVSEETVIEMAKGVLQIMQTDYAIAVSGIMGPDGGTADKPVGTVWVGVANKERIETKKFSFRFERRRNIELTAINSLDLLRRFILRFKHE
jgi:nicotinamide-nucleotide amidase